MADSEEATAVQVLIDDLKSDDVEARVAAMQQLTVVAKALGAQRTVDELVPFLSEQVEDDDEVLLRMAEQLGELVPDVLGFTEAVKLLSILGVLCTVEETVVRDQAVESTNKIVAGLSSQDVQEHAVPVIQRLTEGDWFTARVSACGLFATAYPRLEDPVQKRQLREWYKKLAGDDTPMVRRAASKHIGAFAQAAEKEAVMSELLSIFTTLAGDEQDSVRLLAIENCTALAKVLNQDENRKHILPLVHSCAEDKSWRVRNNVAREFYQLSSEIGQQETIETLLPLFVRLLQDPEAEVRASAAKNVAGYCDVVGPQNFVSAIVPTLRDLSSDLAQNVRMNLAESIMEAIPKLGSEATHDHVLDHALLFLRDTVPEVRLKILSSLGNLIFTIGAEIAQEKVLPSILSLCSDQQWRVREQVVEQMPFLAQYLGPSVFDQKLFVPYINALTDQFSSVRAAATRTLAPLGKQMGADWCLSKMVPKLRELFDNAGSYLGRITVLYAIQFLCSEPEIGDLSTEVTPILLKGTQDRVPNVRFVAAKVVGKIAAAGGLDKGALGSDVKPCLQHLETDQDKDVQHFARVALEACEAP